MVTTQEIRLYEAEARQDEAAARHAYIESTFILKFGEKVRREVDPQYTSDLGRKNTLAFLHHCNYGDIVSKYLDFGDIHRTYFALHGCWHPSTTKMFASCLRHTQKGFISTLRDIHKSKIPKVDLSMCVGFIQEPYRSDSSGNCIQYFFRVYFIIPNKGYMRFHVITVMSEDRYYIAFANYYTLEEVKKRLRRRNDRELEEYVLENSMIIRALYRVGDLSHQFLWHNPRIISLLELQYFPMPSGSPARSVFINNTSDSNRSFSSEGGSVQLSENNKNLKNKKHKNLKNGPTKVWIQKENKNLENQEKENKNIHLHNTLFNSEELIGMQVPHPVTAEEFAYSSENEIKDITNGILQAGDLNVSSFIRENDFIIKLVEDTIVAANYLLPSLKKDNNGRLDWDTIRFTFLCVMKLRMKNSLLLTALDAAQGGVDLRVNMDYIFGLMTAQQQADDSEDNDDPKFVRSLRDVFDKWSDFQKTGLYKRLYKLMTYLLTFQIFEKIGVKLNMEHYSLFQSDLLKKNFIDSACFASSILETLLYIVEKGFQILKTGNTDCLFHSSKTYIKFHDDVQVLKRQYLFINNPEAHGFNEHSFRKNLDDLIEKGEAIYKFDKNSSVFDKKAVTSYLNDLFMIKAEMCTKSAAREPRSPPYAILVCGDSGIGKSTIKDILFQHFGKVNGLDTDPVFCYTRNFAAKFADGFTTSQWCMILDDVAFMHPNKAPNGDPSVMEFLVMINTVQYCPDQADLRDKGRTPLRCKLVIATTNTEDLNAHYYFSCASAAQRRFPYILEPTVRPEFRSEGTEMIDPLKVKEANLQDYPDIWLWTIKKVYPVSIKSGIKKATIKEIHKDLNMIQFLEWYNSSIMTHNENLITLSQSISTIADVKLCYNCNLPIRSCTCVQLQVGESGKGYFVDFGIHIFSCISWLVVKFFLHFVLRFPILHGFAFRLLENYIFRSFRNAVFRATMEYNGMLHTLEAHYPKLLGIFAAMITATIAFAKTYPLFSVSTELQGGVISSDVGKKPSGSDKIENVWYKSEFQLSPMDLTPSIKSSKGLSKEQFVDLFSRSCAYICTTTPKGKTSTGRLTCLKGQIYITNDHVIPLIPQGTCVRAKLVFGSSVEGVNENIEINIDETNITRFETGDILLIRLPIPNKKGILRYIPEKSFDLKHNGYYISKSPQGSTELNNVTIIRDGPRFEQLINERLNNYCEITGLCEDKPYKGFCGSILIAETHFGPAVVGMHVRGSESSNTCSAVPIHRDVLMSLMENFPTQFDQGYVAVSAPSSERLVGSLHKKSTFRYVQNGTASVIGSYQGFRPHPKSMVETTPMSKFLNYEIKFGKPSLSSWEPWRNATVELTQPLTDYCNSTLRLVSESFYSDIVAHLPKEEYDLLHVYDDFTAINGAASVRFVDKINRNTSAGLPWRKPKRHFMSSCEEEMYDLPDAVSVDSEIMDRVNAMMESYLNDETCHPVTCGSLKDEPRKFEKIKQHKTRLFNGAPMDFVILMRKYFLSTVRVIQRNHFVFEAAPGIVAQSTEWQGLYRYLVTHGAHKIVAGDYAMYDKQMISDFILEAFQILIKLCRKSGNFSEEDLHIMCGISYDIAFPMIDLNGDLIRLWCSNPSGHPLTVIINCLVNSLYIRYCYTMLNPNKECSSFRDNVSLMTYGDDNIMGVSDSVPWFDHTTLTQALKDMGINYTMADKSSVSVPYIDIEDSTFLKRRWRFDKHVGAFLAPLEMDSIERSLMVWTRSKSVSEQEQGIDIIASAANEWWFYGKDKYEEEILKLKNLVSKLGWSPWIKESTFISWNQQLERFRSNSRLLHKK